MRVLRSSEYISMYGEKINVVGGEKMDGDEKY
jgi:hypothetical protein